MKIDIGPVRPGSVILVQVMHEDGTVLTKGFVFSPGASSLVELTEREIIVEWDKRIMNNNNIII